MKTYYMLHLDSFDISQLGYQIIVSCWDQKSYGRMRRAWLQEFNAKERRAASNIYKRFYDWYLRKGPPQSYDCRPSTYQLIKRLETFFATH